jgi:predicted permease
MDIKNKGLKPILKKKNKKGSLMSLPINLLMLFITITFMIALIPGFVEMQDMAQQSDQLNCKGFVYDGSATNPLSYNSTIGTKSSIGCMAIKLYLPYIILGVLIAGVALIFYGKSQDQGMGM